MKPHESPRINKNQFVAIRAIRGLCGIGVLKEKKFSQRERILSFKSSSLRYGKALTTLGDLL